MKKEEIDFTEDKEVFGINLLSIDESNIDQEKNLKNLSNMLKTLGKPYSDLHKHNKIIIDTFAFSGDKKKIQLKNGEDSRYVKYIPFDEKYDTKQMSYGLYFLIELGAKNNGDLYIVPEYQRGLVWTLENKQNLIFAIMNGSPIGEFIFAKDTIDTKKEYYHKWTIIDGQQRVQTLKEFYLNQFPDLDGRFFKDYSYREMTYFLENFSKLNIIVIQNLTPKEQVEIYISKNIGGVAHTKEEIDKARKFLDNLNKKDKNGN